MSRRAYVVIVQWPHNQLTTLGQATSCFTGGTENHIGVLVPCCTPEEIEAHSDVRISHPTARGADHVTFDYMADKYPRFQATSNREYWTAAASVWCYPILDVDAAAVHAVCVAAAKIRPYNHGCYRLNGFFGGCWPCACWWSNTPDMAASTCVALTMRIVASARTKSMVPFTSDRTTLTALDIPSCGVFNPCGAGALVGFRPRGALEAMQASRVVGRAVDGFEDAIAQCRGGPQKALGATLPNLTHVRHKRHMQHMQRVD